MQREHMPIPRELGGLIQSELILNQQVAALKEELVAIRNDGTTTGNRRERDERIRAKTEAIRKKVAEWRNYRERIDQLLRNVLPSFDAEFEVGARLTQYFEDMGTCLERIRLQARNLQSHLERLLPALNSQYQRESLSYRREFLEALQQTAECGFYVDAVVLRMRNGADNYRKSVEATRFSKIVFPKLRSTDFGGEVESLRGFDPSRAYEEIEGLLSRIRSLEAEQVPMYTQMLNKANNSHDEHLQALLNETWESLRKRIWRDIQAGRKGGSSTDMQVRSQAERQGSRPPVKAPGFSLRPGANTAAPHPNGTPAKPARPQPAPASRPPATSGASARQSSAPAPANTAHRPAAAAPAPASPKGVIHGKSLRLRRAKGS